MTKKTVQIGEPGLRQRSKPLSQKDHLSVSTKKLTQELTDSMRKEGLVGMAAPQIGVNLRVFVTEIRKTPFRKDNLDKLRIFINPKLTWASKRQVKMYEGCGSVCDKGLFGEVKRPEQVEVEYWDEDGEKHRDRFTGLVARVIQHELDHLDGKLFIDRVEDTSSLMDRESYLRKAGKAR